MGSAHLLNPVGDEMVIEKKSICEKVTRRLSDKTKPKYYVYELSNSLTGDVFYVGKGSGERLHHHKKNAIRGEKTLKGHYIRSLIKSGGDVIANKVEMFFEEIDAYAFEKCLIEQYGLENLVNLVPGGLMTPESYAERTRKQEEAKKAARAIRDREKAKSILLSDKFTALLRHRFAYWGATLKERNLVGTGEECVRIFADFLFSLDEDLRGLALQKAGLSLKRDSKTIKVEVLPCHAAA